MFLSPCKNKKFPSNSQETQNEDSKQKYGNIFSGTPGFENVVHLFLFVQRTYKIKWVWMGKIEGIKFAHECPFLSFPILSFYQKHKAGRGSRSNIKTKN